MNILTLFKRMWALFVFASMLLALIAKPFLALLSLLFSGANDDSTKPSYRIGNGFDCNGFNCNGFNCSGFNCSGDPDC